MRIYTLGTAHRDRLDFARILSKHGIQVIFDIRRTPESREEHFRRNGLQALCVSQNVDYIFLGNELGVPPDGDIRAWTRSDEFQRWTNVLRRKVEQRVCCLLCAEHTPELCRRRVIGEELSESGIEVVHLLDENRVWQPRPRSESPRPPGRASLRGKHPGRGHRPRRHRP